MHEGKLHVKQCIYVTFPSSIRDANPIALIKISEEEESIEILAACIIVIDSHNVE